LRVIKQKKKQELVGGSGERAVAGKLDRFGEVSRGEKMLYSGTDPESYITEYTSVYEENIFRNRMCTRT